MRRPFKFLLLAAVLFSALSFQTSLSPSDIVRQAYYNQRSEAYSMKISMKVIRPNWSRELQFKTWSKGADYGMMVISAPAKDQGISFLRIRSEGWNFLPAIDRTVKISPSQMGQSWMGSDFTNEDLLKEASIVNDYTHRLLGEETLGGVDCYKIEALPKEEASVVWGKILLWIGKGDLLQRKAEYYDEDAALISTLSQSDFKVLGGKTFATTLQMVPSGKPGQKTLVTISAANFQETLQSNFFSTQQMKTLQ